MVNEFFKIEIEGSQFKRAYLIYIVKLTSSIPKYGEYYYISQTGVLNKKTPKIVPPNEVSTQEIIDHFNDQAR